MSRDAAVDAESAPGKSRKPDRRPARTIGKLLDAGLAELRTSSYSSISMRTVAARAGVSAASAYTYFPSKSALVGAVYLGLLRGTPMRTDVNQGTGERVSATLRDMALLAANEPELTAACGTALMADDPAVQPITTEIGNELMHRIRAALGPGWPPQVATTLMMTFAGALMTARFSSFDQIAGQLDDAVDLILSTSTRSDA